MSHFIEEIPAEEEFVYFFESTAIDSDPSEGYWCYKYYEGNLSLSFSFHMCETSVQTVLELDGRVIQVVSCEDAEEIKIDQAKRRIDVSFTKKNNLTKLRIELSPIKIVWSTLKV